MGFSQVDCQGTVCLKDVIHILAKASQHQMFRTNEHTYKQLTNIHTSKLINIHNS